MSNSVGKDEPTDTCGYLGLSEHFRPKRATVSISEQEFLRIMCEEKKVHAGTKTSSDGDGGRSLLDLVMLTIKDIDKFRNGYVTTNELDDILKHYCPGRLGDKDLAPIFNKFSSIQNKILIDYLKFKEWVSNAIKHQNIKDDDIKAKLEAKKLKAANPRKDNRKDNEERADAQRILGEYEMPLPNGVDQAQALGYEM